MVGMMRMLRLAAVFVLIAVTMVTVSGGIATAGDLPEGATISGTVSDPGGAVDDATVYAVPVGEPLVTGTNYPTAGTATTASDGTFELVRRGATHRPLLPGEYNIAVVRSHQVDWYPGGGDDRSQAEVVTVAGTARTGFDISVPAATASPSIFGTVRDVVDPALLVIQNLDGIDVELNGNGQNQSTTTDSLGIFSFDGLSAGSYTLTFTDGGGVYADKDVNVTAPSGTGGETVDLSAGAQITVRTENSQGGQIFGGSVGAIPVSGATTFDVAFRELDKLAPGSYLVYFEATDGSITYYPDAADRADAQLVQVASRADDIDITIVADADQRETTCDVNGDGWADLPVGAPGEGLGAIDDAGAVYVFDGFDDGDRGGIDTSSASVFHQGTPGVPGVPEAGDRFGSDVACGDFDGDGFDDLAIGVPGEDIGSIVDAGGFHVFYGSASGLQASGSVLLSQASPGVAGVAEAGDGLGAVFESGDFDGDGYCDLAAGVPLEDIGTLSDAGIVQVFHGGAGGLSGADDMVITQSSPGIPGVDEAGDRFGSALTAGRLSRVSVYRLSPFDDLFVGVPGEDLGSLVDAGAAVHVPGGVGGLDTTGTHAFTQASPGFTGGVEAGDEFGAALGIHLQSGVPWVIIGSPGEDLGATADAGIAYVYKPLSTAGGHLVAPDVWWLRQGIDSDGTGSTGWPEAGDRFGAVIGGGLIGAPGEDVGAVADAGALLLFGVGFNGPIGRLITQSTPGIPGAVEAGDGLDMSLATIGVHGQFGRLYTVWGLPGEDIGSQADAGFVNVLFATPGLPPTSVFGAHQGTPGVPGTAEPTDTFGAGT